MSILFFLLFLSFFKKTNKNIFTPAISFTVASLARVCPFTYFFAISQRETLLV